MIPEIAFGPEQDGEPSPIFVDRLENNSLQNLEMLQVELEQYFLDLYGHPELWKLCIIPVSWKKQLHEALYLWMKHNKVYAIQIVGNWHSIIASEELNRENNQVSFLEVVNDAVLTMHPLQRRKLLNLFFQQIS